MVIFVPIGLQSTAIIGNLDIGQLVQPESNTNQIVEVVGNNAFSIITTIGLSRIDE